MLVSDFDYGLPPELIAQEPPAERGDSRMLRLCRQAGITEDCQFREFPDLLRPDDVLVFNNTRVFPARLFGHKIPRDSHRPQFSGTPSPSKIEVLLTGSVADRENEWDCLVRPGRKVAIGNILTFGDGDELRAEVVGRGNFGERRIRFDAHKDFFGLLDNLGHIPLPPYINRNDNPADRKRYQTVYAQEPGSIAAPTAGLHFTKDILNQIKARGIEIAEITLHVGLGTFQPIRTDHVEAHQLHRERYLISPEAEKAINDARNSKRRVIAVGTTTVRTLEYVAAQTGEVTSGSGEADIFIYPGYKFRIVDAMLTNFHLPKSTLLMLVCAFAGRDRVLAAYNHAIAQKYRFYSYGDCMFVE